MQIDTPTVRNRLQNFDFTGLFTQELGWDFPGPPLDVNVGNSAYHLKPVADKRGVRVFHLESADSLPDYPTRQQIERQVLHRGHEHLIIFTDAAKSTQIWQWVKREPARPPAYREHRYQPKQQSSEALS